MDPLPLFVERMSTPLGPLLMATDEEDRLRALDWEDFESGLQRLLRLQYRGFKIEWRDRPNTSDAFGAMQAYFDGDVKAIERVDVVLGGTEFQRSVWATLRDIPAGKTISYGELARRIGRPTAVRAVGLANGSNPISVVVPCHRVIGGNAMLTGYGGGLHRKQWLLHHENAMFAGSEVDSLRLPGI